MFTDGGAFGFERNPETLRMTPFGRFSPMGISPLHSLERLTPDAASSGFGVIGRFSTRRISFRDPVWLTQLLPQTSIPGVLDLRPSRALALANYFERYLGPFTTNVPLDVLTLEGNRVVDENCTSL